jgi:hypothetical protein
MFREEGDDVGSLRARLLIALLTGVRGFFKGNGTNCVKVVPASAIRFVSFENYKKVERRVEFSKTVVKSRRSCVSFYY